MTEIRIPGIKSIRTRKLHKYIGDLKAKDFKFKTGVCKVCGATIEYISFPICTSKECIASAEKRARLGAEQKR
jgi:hypothetical protein